MLCGSLLELGSFLFMNDLETNVKLIKKHEKEANVQWPSETWKTVAETILINNTTVWLLGSKIQRNEGSLETFPQSWNFQNSPVLQTSYINYVESYNE